MQHFFSFIYYVLIYLFFLRSLYIFLIHSYFYHLIIFFFLFTKFLKCIINQNHLRYEMIFLNSEAVSMIHCVHRSVLYLCFIFLYLKFLCIMSSSVNKRWFLSLSRDLTLFLISVSFLWLTKGSRKKGLTPPLPSSLVASGTFFSLFFLVSK